MTEPFDFPRELRCDSVMLAKSHPYTADMLGRTATEIERLQKQLEIALTALRRINSLAEKNVPKYAKEIAGEGFRVDVGGSSKP